MILLRTSEPEIIIVNASNTIQIKVQRLFKYFFVIEVIDVEQENKEYIFRVPVVLYKNKVLDEGELSSIKLIVNFIRCLIF